jgi:hypothetical protein
MVGLNDNNILSCASLGLGHKFLFIFCSIICYHVEIKIEWKFYYPTMNYHMACMPRWANLGYPG